MGQSFILLVKQIGIFLIAGQTLLHFGIGSGYEKYIRVVISFMVVAQIAVGVLSIFHKDSGNYVQELITNYEQDMSEMETDLRKLEERMREELKQEPPEPEAEEPSDLPAPETESVQIDTITVVIE